MPRKPSPHTDPIAFANRPLEPGFDAYQAVREHVARLVIEPVKKPACPAS